MLEEKIRTNYLRRSFFAADGLWFMMAEERLNFDEALALDRRVWAIMGKIQARKACELLGIRTKSLGAMVAALELKFDAEEYKYHIGKQEPGHIEVKITECPWIKLLEKSGRQHLSARIAEAICPTDFAAWAKEFGATIAADLPGRMCNGEEHCKLVLRCKESRDGTENSAEGTQAGQP